MASKSPDKPSPPEDVVQLLKGEYGEVLSAVRPYMRIWGISLPATEFTPADGSIKGLLRIRTDHQDPQGTNFEQDNDFWMTQEGLAQAVKDTPAKFRGEMEAMAAALERQRVRAGRGARGRHAPDGAGFPPPAGAAGRTPRRLVPKKQGSGLKKLAEYVIENQAFRTYIRLK